MASEFRLRTLGGLQIQGANGPSRGAAAQRRSLALLAAVAGTRDRGLSRDRLAAMLWPESDEEHARGALAQTLYRVRQELGADVIGSGDPLRLEPARLAVDLFELDDALARGDAERATALYGGPFLDGFHLPGAPEFARWVDGERGRIAARYADTLTRAATTAASAGDTGSAVRWSRALVAVDPLDARAVVRLMRALSAAGDSAGALQAARIHETLLRQELDVALDPSVSAAIAEVRAGPACAPSPRVMAATVATPATVVTPATASPGPSASPVIATQLAGGRVSSSDVVRVVLSRRGMRRAAVLAGLVLATALAAATWSRRHEAPLRLAVGEIADLTGGDTLRAARVLPELLTTGLSRFAPLEVMSRARLYDVASQLGAAPDSSAHVLARAARQGGARVLVDGALYRRPGGSFRLDLRLLDLERGTVRAAYQLEGADAFTLAERATTRLAADVGARRSAPVGEALETTRSLVALQLYEEGLRTFYVGDGPSAERLFAAALKEDSTFAMAAYYASRSVEYDGDRSAAYLARAVRYAPRATERERLIIDATSAAARFDPARVALAETLAARFPAEPGAHTLLGEALVQTRGDFAGARVAFREAFALDSLGLRDGVVRCPACDAQHGIVESLLYADSMEAAEREARKWTSRQPTSAAAWETLATVLDMRGDSARAAEAFRRRSAVVPYAPETVPFMVTVALRAGDFPRAERLVDNVLQTGGPNERREALWWLTIVQRHEGRLGDALAAARELVRGAPDDGPSRQLYAQVLFESGRQHEALAEFDTAAQQARADVAASPSVQARRRTWTMTHLATVSAALGDTTRLAALVEPLRLSGAGSGYGRDHVMHHYARGLLLGARGGGGAAAELGAAIFSPSMGYTRDNVALAKVYLAGGQPEEAVPLLRAALHGSLEASNLYVTHTELHALLVRAFTAAGARDSVAVHRRYVERALARADELGRMRFGALLGQTGTRYSVNR